MSIKDLPALGHPLGIRIAKLKPLAAGIVIIGASDKSWSGSPLPLDVRTIGMPGCSLLVSWDFEIPFFARLGGSFDVTLRIPFDPSLRGRSLFVQAWVLDTKANTLGVVTSNGGKGTFGS